MTLASKENRTPDPMLVSGRETEQEFDIMSPTTTALAVPAPTDLDPATTIDEWLAVCDRALAAAGDIAWVVGDLIAWGEDRYGDEYRRVADIAVAHGVELTTLRDWGWLARAYPVAERTAAPRSVHRALASLPPERRSSLLQVATIERWTAAQAAEAAARVRAELAPAPTPTPTRQLEPTPEPTPAPAVIDDDEVVDAEIVDNPTPPPSPEPAPEPGYTLLLAVTVGAPDLRATTSVIQELEARLRQALAAEGIEADVEVRVQ